jgi:mannose-6-phosphate isomerase
MRWNRPLLFTPLYQNRVWGGRRLQTLFGRCLPKAALPCGESWELCDRPEAQSLLSEPVAGCASLHDLWTQRRQEVFGTATLAHPAARYPLLMKILDACEDLSIQVHPPAEAAAELGGEPKTEMWYVAHAEAGAKLYAGLKAGVDRAGFERALAEGRVAELLHVLEPRPGDVLFLPSGRVHAIGAGLVIFEIQQNSDTTYRVFDWNRLGLDGRPRALHVRESLRSIRFDDAEPALARPDGEGRIVACEHFEVWLGAPVAGRAVGVPGEARVLALTRGGATLGGVRLGAGDFALLPAALPAAARVPEAFAPGTAWLEIRLTPPPASP